MTNTAIALAMVVFLSGSAWPAAEPSSHGEAAIDGDDPRVEADLLVDSTTVAAGARLRVGVRLRMDPDWHVYWKNSGDSGFPSEVDWSSSDANFGSLQYPVPQVFIESAGLGTTYGYEDEVLLISDLVVNENAVGSIRIRAAARFLACKVQCIPGQVQLETTLPVEVVAAPAARELVASFNRYAGRMPARPEELGLRVTPHYSVASVQPGEKFELSIAVDACQPPSKACPESVAFVAPPGEIAIDAPDSLELERVGTLDAEGRGSGSALVMRGRVLMGHVPPDRFAGVLSLLIDGERKGVHVTIDLPGSADGAAASRSKPIQDQSRIDAPTSLAPTLWTSLGFGLLGGLILNLMPCVLPVLALKAYRIIEAGESDAQAMRKEAVAYTLGVLLSMLVLASLVLALRSAGQAVGWGFQFQAPGFLAFMVALLTVFALNLFGLFEITIAPNSLTAVGRESGARLRSFFDGTLVVLLATPCSAPFLGTAVGFAFAGSAVAVVWVFLAIGLGLALP